MISSIAYHSFGAPLFYAIDSDPPRFDPSRFEFTMIENDPETWDISGRHAVCFRRIGENQMTEDDRRQIKNYIKSHTGMDLENMAGDEYMMTDPLAASGFAYKSIGADRAKAFLAYWGFVNTNLGR